MKSEKPSDAMTVIDPGSRPWRLTGRLIADLVILSRPLASLSAGTEVFVGGHLGQRPGASDALLLREGIAISLVTAAVNVVNDIRDVRADAVSRPNRPLPAGRLSPAAAWLLACFQAASALLLSADVPNGTTVSIILLVIGIAYSYVLKGTVLLGNCVVALLAASPIIYGGYLGRVRALPVVTAALIVFAFMFAFEVLKTIRDVYADGAAGYQTVATKWGIRSAAAIFRILLAAYVATASVPVLVESASADYIVFMGLGAVVPSSLAGWLSPISRSPGAVRVVLQVMTISWIPGMVALALTARH